MKAAEKYDREFHSRSFKLQFIPSKNLFLKRVGWKRPEIKTVLTEGSPYLPGHSTLVGMLSEILVLLLI